MAQVRVPKVKCMELPNSMDFHRIQYQWRQQMYLLYRYHFIGEGGHNIPFPDRMSENNTSRSNMWFDLTA